MKKVLVLSFLLFITARLTAGDDFCGIRNKSFLAGEQISFIVFYNALGLYVNAGTASFITTLERVNNKPAYHVVGVGQTNSSYDWIYKVRDRYETFFDTATLQPYRFIRNVEEGGYKKYENVTFNQVANTAITTNGVYKVPNCVQDVLSAIYYARNIDFSRYKENDKIPFNMFMDNEVFNLYIRYIGRETLKTRYGKFRTIKFKPLLVKGTLFEGGERMTVWVTDDLNHVPVRIESPIVVGSVKVDLMKYNNLRYPLTSFLGFK